MTSSVEHELEVKRARRRLKRFDGVSALLEAALTMTGAAVLILAALAIAHRVWPSKKPSQAMEVVEIARGEEEGMAGNDPELGEGALPTTDELPMRDGALAFEDTDVVQTLSAVLDAASTSEMDLADPSQRSGMPGGGRPGQPGGEGRQGTGRGKGGVPTYSRWDIRYPSQNSDEYAASLDFFGIELGVVRGKELTLVSQLSKGSPLVRKGAPSENRLYFQWQDASRRRADTELLRAKGIASAGAVVVQFYPAELEQKLAALEKKESKQPVERIRKTSFAVRPTGNQTFEFYVAEITYLR